MQVQSVPDAVARSLYVLRAPAATRVQLELASLPATGWAIYTRCQAIKCLSVNGRSGESSQHFRSAEQGTWAHTCLFLEQYVDFFFLRFCDEVLIIGWWKLTA